MSHMPYMVKYEGLVVNGNYNFIMANPFLPFLS